uniref:Pyridine nucleotide-disulphide oxidoreductase dimerisation domain-containing protein n=1 Tax=Romanomermis culicivorax TaxID=13658 RepID=A0A915I7G0_ROMCU
MCFDYHNVPTTVFTPIEYGCCGYSEEMAKEKFGEEVVVYHSRFTPLEYTVARRKPDIDSCYAKVIFVGDNSRPKDLRVIGIHYLGPNAGEVTQGFGLALKLKAKMSDLTSLVGIHPTTAEVFTFPSMQLKTDAPLVAGGC